MTYSHLSNLHPLTAADEAVVMSNLGLIGFVISRWCGYCIGDGYGEDDAWQDGYLGLCIAVQDFDPDRGRLSTYAVPRIRSAIQRGKGAHAGVSWRARSSSAAPAGHNAVVVSIESIVDAGVPFEVASPGDDFDAVDVDDLVARLRALLCRDDLDRDVLALRIAALVRRPSAELAAAHGVTRQTVINRENRLLAEFRRQFRRDLEAAR